MVAYAHGFIEYLIFLGSDHVYVGARLIMIVWGCNMV